MKFMIFVISLLPVLGSFGLSYHLDQTHGILSPPLYWLLGGLGACGSIVVFLLLSAI